jgi:hypothetical protein
MILGITFGCVIALIAGGLVFWFCYKRRQKKTGQSLKELEFNADPGSTALSNKPSREQQAAQLSGAARPQPTSVQSLAPQQPQMAPVVPQQGQGYNPYDYAQQIPTIPVVPPAAPVAPIAAAGYIPQGYDASTYDAFLQQQQQYHQQVTSHSQTYTNCFYLSPFFFQLDYLDRSSG